MDTKTLLEIVRTRIECEDSNESPTTKSFLYELNKALERLKKYESASQKVIEECKDFYTNERK